ncbi:type 2 lactosamine alpha-2,3-sialyltransferase isoform X2 [Hemicordylus capensis]|uniref:type 2 lactosamine alpha-2,3-sialyltransferase isoform X2 n=1 Tax=Hemicordylus capensis TaxID=884348 RepID=UPI002303386E|nr:type 2 lactosamine alpha-2,3-sialyltransferase isoform X2 [Hemicordylus capensis]
MTDLKDLLVMRRILLAIILAAGVMYVILHCNLWRTNGYWLPSTDTERKGQLIACALKANVSAFLKQENSPLRTPAHTVSLKTKEPEVTSGWQAEILLPASQQQKEPELQQQRSCWQAGRQGQHPRGQGVNTLYPFLCLNNFLDVSELHGSHRIELPYGIKKAEKYFQLALSRLQSCGLFREVDSSSCKKCVVVGNGGVLRNKSLGETIDSYDVVIRMNNGPVVGYEEDVGRRTTFRLFYPESVFSDPIHYDPNTTAVLVVFKPHDLKWLWDLLSGQRLIRTNAFWKKPALQMIYKSSQIRILDPAITRRTAYDWLHLPSKFSKLEKPKHPTTGLIAIAFAFNICSDVHLAGFKYNFSDRNSSLHYYGNDTMSLMIQNGYHDIAAEQKFLKELMDRNIVVNLTEE